MLRLEDASRRQKPQGRRRVAPAPAERVERTPAAAATINDLSLGEVWTFLLRSDKGDLQRSASPAAFPGASSAASSAAAAATAAAALIVVGDTPRRRPFRLDPLPSSSWMNPLPPEDAHPRLPGNDPHGDAIHVVRSAGNDPHDQHVVHWQDDPHGDAIADGGDDGLSQHVVHWQDDPRSAAAGPPQHVFPSTLPLSHSYPHSSPRSRRRARHAKPTSTTNDPPADRRLYWLDWCRTQSVWNVVLGHAWWAISDITGLVRNGAYVPRDRSPPWTEGTRMVEYAVDQGTFHTVPLFFLVSGVLMSRSFRYHGASQTVRGACRGIGRFFRRRALRLVPPFVLGSLVLLLLGVASSGAVPGFATILLSHLWFLWALLGMQIAALPFCLCCRLAVAGDLGSRPGSFTAAFLAHAAVCAGACVVGDMAFGVLASGRPAWVMTMPAATCAALGVWVIAGSPCVKRPGREATRALLCLLGIGFLVAGTFAMSVHPVCPTQRAGCGEFAWLSVNMALSLVLIFLCYLVGFAAEECSSDIASALANRPAAAGLTAVSALMLSCFWPLFTYWGEDSIRRSGFLKVYQSVPTNMSIADIVSMMNATATAVSLNAPVGGGETSSGANAAGVNISGAGGGQFTWGIARMWFWMLAMLVFAKALCNHQLWPALHRHVTQSGIVIFVLSPMLNEPVAKALWRRGLTDAVGLFAATTAAAFAASLGLYCIAIRGRFGALLGIALVDSPPPANQCCAAGGERCCYCCCQRGPTSSPVREFKEEGECNAGNGTEGNGTVESTVEDSKWDIEGGMEGSTRRSGEYRGTGTSATAAAAAAAAKDDAGKDIEALRREIADLKRENATLKEGRDSDQEESKGRGGKGGSARDTGRNELGQDSIMHSVHSRTHHGTDIDVVARAGRGGWGGGEKHNGGTDSDKGSDVKLDVHIASDVETSVSFIRHSFTNSTGGADSTVDSTSDEAPILAPDEDGSVDFTSRTTHRRRPRWTHCGPRVDDDVSNGGDRSADGHHSDDGHSDDGDDDDEDDDSDTSDDGGKGGENGGRGEGDDGNAGNASTIMEKAPATPALDVRSPSDKKDGPTGGDGNCEEDESGDGEGGEGGDGDEGGDGEDDNESYNDEDTVKEALYATAPEARPPLQVQGGNRKNVSVGGDDGERKDDNGGNEGDAIAEEASATTNLGVRPLGAAADIIVGGHSDKGGDGGDTLEEAMATAVRIAKPLSTETDPVQDPEDEDAEDEDGNYVLRTTFTNAHSRGSKRLLVTEEARIVDALIKVEPPDNTMVESPEGGGGDS